MPRIQIELGARSYPVFIANGLLDSFGNELRSTAEIGSASTGKAAIISDSRVDPLYGQRCERSLREAGFTTSRCTVPAGETSKSIGWVEGLAGLLAEQGIDRTGFVVALGGGMVGDLAGFLASVYMRGLPLLQVPTTLLAQVDSAIGGKTAVNHPLAKNLLGTFHQPKAVFCDPTLLGSLPERDFVHGLAEVVKYGVIRSLPLFEQLEQNRRALLEKESELLSEVIADCCRIKGEVVASDERDEGLRQILNYGHTFGHALEATQVYRGITHGEAVAIGMTLAADLARRTGVLQDPGLPDRQGHLLKRLGLPVQIPSGRRELGDFIKRDKKFRAGRPIFVLPIRIGEVVVREVPWETVEATLQG
jgi:3-dehydroquinate synthase